MPSDIDFNLIISNVIGEKRFSHCRLCLKPIQGAYVRFEDSVAGKSGEYEFKPLSDVLEDLLGPYICEDIPAVEAVCVDCVDMVLKCHKFIAQCHSSTQLLHRILDNLHATLDITINEDQKDQHLYIMIKGETSKAVFLDKIVDSCLNNITAEEHKCNQCNGKYSSRKCLVKHCIDKHSMTQDDVADLNDSGHCSETYTHKPKQDSSNSLFICKSCGKSYTSWKKLQAHESKHEIPAYECPRCRKKYLTRDSLKKHVQLCLENRIERHPFRKVSKVFCCTECDKQYGTPGGLRVHQRFAHQNETPHVCPFCGKTFPAPSVLKAHIIKHTGEKNYRCHICQKLFVSKDAVLYHIRRHTGEKPYDCNYCDEKFVNASARAEHLKYKHKEPTQTCPICMKKFYTSSFLRQHIGRHHDPSSKLYTARNNMPPDQPCEQNKRIKVTISNNDEVQYILGSDEPM